MRGLFSDTWRKNPDTTIFVCATWLWRCKATPCPLSSACLVLDCCAIKNVLLNFALCLVLPQPSKPQPEPSLFVGQLLRKDETKLGTQDASRRPSWPQASEWPRRDARSVNNPRGFPYPYACWMTVTCVYKNFKLLWIGLSKSQLIWAPNGVESGVRVSRRGNDCFWFWSSKLAHVASFFVFFCIFFYFGGHVGLKSRRGTIFSDILPIFNGFWFDFGTIFEWFLAYFAHMAI